MLENQNNQSSVGSDGIEQDFSASVSNASSSGMVSDRSLYDFYCESCRKAGFVPFPLEKWRSLGRSLNPYGNEPIANNSGNENVIPDGNNNGNNNGGSDDNGDNSGADNGPGDDNGTNDPFLNWSDILGQLGDWFNLLNDPSNWLSMFKLLGEQLVGMIEKGRYTSFFKDMSASDKRNFVNQIMTNYYNFASAMYQQYYSQQMWLVQQNYNSPVEQMKRMAAAGINPVFGGVKSNLSENAPETADFGGTDPIPDQGSYLAMQKKQNRINNILGFFGLGVQTITSGFSAAGMFQQLALQKSLLPAQKALLGKQSEYLENKKGVDSMNAWSNALNVTAQASLGFSRLSLDDKLSQRNFDLGIKVAELNRQTALDTNQASNSAMIESAKIGASAVRYNADSYSSSMKYGADQAYLSAIRMADVQGLGHLTRHISEMSMYETEEYFSSVDSEGKVHFVTSGEGKLHSILSSASSKVEAGGSFKFGETHYTKHSISKKTFNPDWLSYNRALADKLDSIDPSNLDSSGKRYYSSMCNQLQFNLSRSLNAAPNSMAEKQSNRVGDYFQNLLRSASEHSHAVSY